MTVHRCKYCGREIKKEKLTRFDKIYIICSGAIAFLSGVTVALVIFFAK